jgi:hypothetical protein
MKIDMNKMAQELHAKALALMPPPIPFDHPTAKGSSGSGEKKTADEDSNKFVSFDCRLNPRDKNSEKITYKIKVFEAGTPEDYCKWRSEYDDLASKPSFTNPEAKLSIILSVLKGKARDKFQSEYDTIKGIDDGAESEEDKVGQDGVIKMALNELAKDVFRMEDAEKQQKRYMRNNLCLKGGVRDWTNRLVELNKYFTYFPEYEGKKTPAPLEDDELLDILDRAKPVTWLSAALRCNVDVSAMSWNAMITYFEKLEMDDAINKKSETNQDHSKNHTGKRKRGSQGKTGGKQDQKSDFTRKEECKHCKKWHKVPDSECWSLKKNDSKKPKYEGNGKGKTKAPKSEKAFTFTPEQVCQMMAALPTFQQKPVKKRAIQDDSDSESENGSHTNGHTSNANDSEYSEFYCHSIARPSKKTKSEQPTTEVIVEITDRKGDTKPIRCLLDTGTSATIILREFVAPGKAKGYKNPEPTRWATMGGVF